MLYVLFMVENEVLKDGRIVKTDINRGKNRLLHGSGWETEVGTNWRYVNMIFRCQYSIKKKFKARCAQEGVAQRYVLENLMHQFALNNVKLKKNLECE